MRNPPDASLDAFSAATPRISRRAQGPQKHDASIDVAGHEFVADPSGVLVWPAQRLLIVADLHLEKGSAYARRGKMLPPYDTRETLQRLTAAIDIYAPATVIALGDLIHDVGADQRIVATDLETLRSLQRGRDWLWITGNHDPSIAPSLGGASATNIEVAGLSFVHVPGSGTGRAEIAAHLHPVAKLVRKSQSTRRRCFISDGNRLILPAFGAFTGGLNVLDPAFSEAIANDKARVWMLGRDAVFAVGLHQLSPD